MVVQYSLNKIYPPFERFSEINSLFDLALEYGPVLGRRDEATPIQRN